MNQIEEFLGMANGELWDIGIRLGTKIIMTVAILIGGFWLSKILTGGMRRLLERRETERSLVTFLHSLVNIVIKTLVIITAFTQLGLEMTSFVAILGAAGLAIGMAFSGTLSNFAGGVIILLLRPFKVGDFIETQTQTGTVKEITIFNTILATSDNKIIILANGAVANNTIVNYTKAEKRRVDWSFAISYGDDLKTAKDVLQKFIYEEPRIIKDSEVFIGLGQLTDAAVNITVRVWVVTEDYWPVFYAMNERVYREFSKHGLHPSNRQGDLRVQNN
jgi:small conductance mechanosensitive channel